MPTDSIKLGHKKTNNNMTKKKYINELINITGQRVKYKNKLKPKYQYNSNKKKMNR
jgi:hypothetical protein